MASNNTSFERIDENILYDSILTAHLQNFIFSAFYGLSEPIDKISDVIKIC
jgi:HD-like signal output (HDOD) protein